MVKGAGGTKNEKARFVMRRKTALGTAYSTFGGGRGWAVERRILCTLIAVTVENSDELRKKTQRMRALFFCFLMISDTLRRSNRCIRYP